MSHFIILSSPPHLNTDEITYRIRADRIDWIASTHGPETVVSVNGKEFRVMEPAHVILDYIKNPDAPLIMEDEWEHAPTIFSYEKKYGKKEGKRRYLKDMHIPHKENVNTPTMPLGKHTGRAALADRAKTLGYELDAELLTRVFDDFKALVDRQTNVDDDDLVKLIEQAKIDFLLSGKEDDSKLVGDFRKFTEKEKEAFARWCQTDEAKKIFKEASEECKREAESFRQRTTMSHEQMHRPFTIS
jgi:hypothetical protein